MDEFDAARVLHRRIIQFESEHVARKVIGYSFMNLYSIHELVSWQDKLIINLIHHVKLELGLTSIPSKQKQIPEVVEFPEMFGANSIEEDQLSSPGSLENLELGIVEMLKLRGSPISIASLPILYYEEYGSFINEAEGYSLTELVAQMKNIRLIGRIPGEQSVILEEDARTYMKETQYEGNYPGPIRSRI
ncbi:hypothetical protein LguiA_023385 [Lonicera macranthoides]